MRITVKMTEPAEKTTIRYKFYKTMIMDLEKGFMSLPEAKALLVDFEREEKYEACAGIQRAINEFISPNQ